MSAIIMRRSRTWLLAVFILIAIFYLYSQSSRDASDFITALPGGQHQPSSPQPPPAPPPTWEEAPEFKAGPTPLPGPESGEEHPIQHLVADAQRSFQDIKKKQSHTLEDAVKEYRRRYGIPPPPNFDKWFYFASKNGLQLVDEFDTIYDLLTPFWGLKPSTIRSRAREALGADNSLLGVSIRNNAITHIQGGPEWQQNATRGMIEKFVKWLPDMDLAFNIHDEPRVVVPHDDLSRLVEKAKKVNMPAANTVSSPINDFSKMAPELLKEGTSFEEVKTSRFNVFAHQATWTNSRMSCPPDSPARTLDDDERSDDQSKYGYSKLGFVYNSTAVSDICLTPSLSSMYGFFDRPNAYNVVHDLFPIFSQSKISSYGDLIYPSPWYWFDKVVYDQDSDMSWEDKHSSLYWRGSTTGGFSRAGGWRRQHRQNFVHKINAPDDAKIMSNSGTSAQPQWNIVEVPRGQHRDLIDVHFSHIGQCDPGDCEAQQAFFDVVDMVEPHEAWGYKYLLDMDGNAFSGRFYAFLRSRSLTFKQAVFREWHNEWLRPWIHYVPLSLRGDDWLESVRYMEGEASEEAKKIATQSSDWANKVLRKVDMEAWFFRLLLEYGRVIDEKRDVIGYNPASAGKKLADKQDA